MALSGLQIVNTIVRLIATAHLTYGSYSMYYAVIPSHILPIDPAFCGKLKYLTFWNVVSTRIIFRAMASSGNRHRKPVVIAI